jgi:cytolysin (calcineurin-like family phosphatase)
MNTDQRSEIIDLGQTGYRAANCPGVLFFTREAIADRCQREAIESGAVTAIDTRPTIRDVCAAIKADEGAAWEEYLTGNYEGDKERWPVSQSYNWLAVYVVTGGSEGLYLHVDTISGDNKRRCLIYGKTLLSNAAAFADCYESAGRIAARLQA